MSISVNLAQLAVQLARVVGQFYMQNFVLTLIKAVLIAKSFANTCMLICIFNTISILFIFETDIP